MSAINEIEGVQNDQPAESRPVAAPPDIPAVDTKTIPREANVLRIQPRFRQSGTDRYDKHKVAGTEIIKIPFKYNELIDAQAASGKGLAFVKELWKLMDDNLGTSTESDPATPFYLTTEKISPVHIGEDPTKDAIYTVVNRLIGGTIADTPGTGFYYGEMVFSSSGPNITTGPFFYTMELSADVCVDFRMVPAVTAQLYISSEYFVQGRFATCFYEDPNFATNIEEIQQGTYDIHQILSNRSISFDKYEAYSLHSLEATYTSSDNFFKSTASLYIGYVDDPYITPSLEITQPNERYKTYRPRLRNWQSFNPSASFRWTLPIHPNNKYFTWSNNGKEKRFFSPGSITFGAITFPGDNHSYSLTLTAVVKFFCPTITVVENALGATISHNFAKALEAVFDANDKFMPVTASFTDDQNNLEDGEYFALQPINCTIQLPFGPFYTTLTRFSVQNFIVSFKVPYLDNFSIDFSTSPVYVLRFSYSDNYFYRVSK